MKKFIYTAIIAMFFVVTNSIAQNWQPLGPNDNNQPSFAAATNTCIKANHAGVIYMAYKDVNDLLLSLIHI